jgi:hypothetical protein
MSATIEVGDYIIGGSSAFDLYSYAAGALGAKKIRFDMQEETGLDYADSGAPTYSLTQLRNDPIYRAFLKANKPAAAGAATEQVTLENNKTIGGSTAGAPGSVAIDYAGVTAVGGERLVIISFQKLSAKSGAFSRKANTINRAATEFEGSEFPEDIAIPATAFDSALVTGAALITVPKGTLYTEIFLDAVTG